MTSYLKWVGGKKRLMPDISLFLPNTKINKYIEPFVGSASVIIWLYQNRYDNYIDNQVNINNTQFFLNDANKALINTHIQIKNNTNNLICQLEKRQLDFNNSINKTDFYYERRKELNYFLSKLYENKLSNNEKIEFAALFILINKTCWNGMWRVNKNNKYNIPCNKTNNVKIFHKNNIIKVANIFKNMTFFSLDFYDFIKNNIEKNDFIFLDPPYVPVVDTSFTNYNKNGWGHKDNLRLKKILNHIDNIGAKFLMTNSGDLTVNKIFNSNNWNIKEIFAHRFIKPVKAKNNEKRNKVKELIIRNYNN